MIRGYRLLDIVNSAVISSRIGSVTANESRAPVAFEIELDQRQVAEPAVKKRLEEREKHILTIDEITEKLTRAQILRTKM